MRLQLIKSNFFREKDLGNYVTTSWNLTDGHHVPVANIRIPVSKDMAYSSFGSIWRECPNLGRRPESKWFGSTYKVKRGLGCFCTVCDICGFTEVHFNGPASIHEGGFGIRHPQRNYRQSLEVYHVTWANGRLGFGDDADPATLVIWVDNNSRRLQQKISIAYPGVKPLHTGKGYVILRDTQQKLEG